ncbi:MAG TPA: cytochrome b562 [Opitutaceae bacterium]|jgi:soluble cytochrome b562
MKLRPSLALLLALPIVSPSFLLADDQPPPPSAPQVTAPQAAPAQKDEKKTDLEKRMDRVGRAVRKLKRQVADPAKNASSLELIATVQTALGEAVDFTPAKAQDIPEDQRPKFIDDFKAGIKGMQDEFTKLSDAITAGKNDDASKILAEILNLEKKDHHEFKRPEKD